MSDFVQQRLVNRVIVEAFGEVAGDRDALATEIAQSRATRRPIEGETPRVVEVQRNEGFRPVPHAW